MKIFVILAALFAFTQATSEPQTIQQVAAAAYNTCYEESHYAKAGEILKHPILPEDNPIFATFFACYWKEAKVIKIDGTFDHEYLKVAYPHLIRDKYPNISEADAQTLASDAVEHCKDTPTGDSIGLKGIQYRNCMTTFVIDKQ